MTAIDATEDTARLTESDLIPDRALGASSEDALGYVSVAATLADLVRHVSTPTNVALFGPWGSGKSSVFGMLKEQLAKHDSVALVRYDAWKFGGHSLQRNFLTHVAADLNLKPRHIERIHGSTETARLRLGTFFFRNWASIIGAFIVGLIAAAIWAAARVSIATRWQDEKWKAALADSYPSATLVLGGVLGGLLLGNQVMSSAIEKRSQAPMQDADQFFGAFNALMRIVTSRWRMPWSTRVQRLVVFIDELDRCTPNDVVRTLADLLTFLDHKQCVFVVAADREAIEEALEYADQAKPMRENEPYYSTSGAYLDKVFQHQLALPPPRAEALTKLAMQLAEKRAGIWKKLKDHDERVYEDVVYSLVPAHVRSPRRVKVLMNNFVTNWHVMQGRSMNPLDRATELAVMTVLSTEFPSVVRDLQRQPLLLEALAHQSNRALQPELQATVKKYTPSDDPDKPSESAASPAPLLVGDDATADDGTKKRATNKLNEQLNSYLRKIHAAGIDLPKTDLIYLQSAAHAHGLSDAKLAELLDLAADTAPEQTVESFRDATEDDKVAAIRFLATQVSNNWGAPRANLVEAACRLALQISIDSARLIAREVAPTLLSEARRGRWRHEATPGAIWLGLHDPLSDPIGRLSSADLLDDHATTGEALNGLAQRVEALGDAAAPLYPLYGNAYATHYASIHQMYGDLPSRQVNLMWETQQGYMRNVITDTSTGAVQPHYFRGLLDALITRPTPDVQEVTLAVALLAAEEPTLYDELHVTIPAIFENGITEARLSNALITNILTFAPAAHVNDWSLYVDPNEPFGEGAGEAAQRLAKDLTSGAQRPTGELVETIEWLSPALTELQCEDVASLVLSSLMSNPPNGDEKTTSLWDALRSVLRSLRLPPTVGYEGAYVYEALLNSATRHAITPMGIPDAKRHLRALTPVQAQGFDAKLAAITGTADQLSQTARLRIAARTVAGQPPLPYGEIEDLTTGAKGSYTMDEEWLRSNPRPSEVAKLLKAVRLNPTLIEVYAPLRNTPERSKMWIQLEKLGRRTDSLTAIGKYGVDSSVVAHMKGKILAATTQTLASQTKRLGTINIAASTPARNAVQDIVQELLATNFASVGAPAVRLILDTGGAAPGRKPELRRALDAYTKAVPRHRISQSDLRELNNRGLLSKHKRSPLAKMFGW